MTTQARFPAASRLLHWMMAPMIVAMLFIGVGMAASVSARYDLLVSIHRPLGIAILVLCVIRIVNRFINPPPELPDTLPSMQRFAAKASHIVLYALMFIMPLVGWGMLSAARYPIVLYGPLRLPPILPHDLTLYAWLRDLHTVLAYLLFATFLVHFAAALYHGLIRRDGVFWTMAS
jgi:cytochrome b561